MRQAGGLEQGLLRLPFIRPDKRALIPSSLNDSKKISAKKRALIETDLRTQKDDAIHDFESATAIVVEIDTHGILQANFFAMGRAVEALRRLLKTDPLNLAATGQCQIAHIFMMVIYCHPYPILPQRLSKVMGVFCQLRLPPSLRNKHEMPLWQNCARPIRFMDGIAIKAMARVRICKDLIIMAFVASPHLFAPIKKRLS